MRTQNSSRALRAMVRGALFVTVAAGSAAFAQPQSQIDVSGQPGIEGVTRMRAVRVSDLNLADARGRKRLDDRLQNASARVCDGAGATWIKPPRDYTDCVDAALGAARTQAAQRLASGSAADIRIASR
jgi:UrcA family protein